jgi:lysozyme family protein
MADVIKSVMYVLRQEDAHMCGVVTNDSRDIGGRTRWGIAEHFHPEQTLTGFFSTMNNADSLAVAQSIYTEDYADPLHIVGIVDQQVANAMLSFAINEGVKTSIKLLQAALQLTADGVIGPATLAAVNSTSNILSLLSIKQAAHYNAIVAANPIDERFIKGWINRVNQDCETT